MRRCGVYAEAYRTGEHALGETIVIDYLGRELAAQTTDDAAAR